MYKTVFHINKMDCPSEENLIRMKLEGIKEIKRLDFDLEQRNLDIFHSAKNSEIESVLASLNLGSQRIETTKTREHFSDDKRQSQSRLLWSVLLINFSFFLIEIGFGLVSKSMGLVADSLDMLADAIVYGLSLWAVGGAVSRKKKVAKWSGYFQLLLALTGIVELIRRFIGFEALPDFRVMIVVSVFALLANYACLYLLHKSKSKEAHMKASMIFTSNDIIINTGVIAAGLLVMLTQSKYPDLIIGAIVFIIVVRGALRILKLGK
ncbi:cation transporter [Maribellus comscasis]|uniref:Cation transporter n=1 Tax=Maribellus comscasis TaxID=2681766 RepID=A0A6I6K947_9BACT|nr:cation transporter [Maribellus comscasis]QGY46594.1 cation transporter [Maribellus comscasis]